MSTGDPAPNPVWCSACGAPWPPGGSPEGCPECGGTSKTVAIQAAEEINVAESIELKLTPGDQSRDWKQVWVDLEQDVGRLAAARLEDFSGENIRSAFREVFSIYVRAYHLKDALIAASPSTGVSHAQIEAAITNDPDLALLADLANLDKHYKLNRPPRSGDVPTIGPAHGIRAGSGADGWRLMMEITHQGQVLDGLDVADASVRAWRRHLSGWGLI